MITLDEFTKEMRESIEDAVKTSLAKLGINVSVVLNFVKNRSGEMTIKLETSEFQTTPVIYESVHVDGWGQLIETQDKNGNIESAYSLIITLNYRFSYFRGGENGVEIGTLKFNAFEFKDGRKVLCFLGFTI